MIVVESAPVKIFEKEIKSESCGLSSKSDSFSNKYGLKIALRM